MIAAVLDSVVSPPVMLHALANGNEGVATMYWKRKRSVSLGDSLSSRYLACHSNENILGCGSKSHIFTGLLDATQDKKK